MLTTYCPSVECSFLYIIVKWLPWSRASKGYYVEWVPQVPLIKLVKKLLRDDPANPKPRVHPPLEHRYVLGTLSLLYLWVYLPIPHTWTPSNHYTWIYNALTSIPSNTSLMIASFAYSANILLNTLFKSLKQSPFRSHIPNIFTFFPTLGILWNNIVSVLQTYISWFFTQRGFCIPSYIPWFFFKGPLSAILWEERSSSILFLVSIFFFLLSFFFQSFQTPKGLELILGGRLSHPRVNSLAESHYTWLSQTESPLEHNSLHKKWKSRNKNIMN